jgi:hypothetical protein
MPEEMHEDLNFLSDKAIDCRDYGHAWKRSEHWTGVTDGGRSIAGYEREIVCRECGTTRRDFIDARTGERTTEGYSYPDNYLAGQGHGRIFVHQIRKERLRRMLANQKEAKRVG